jgi:endonuclease/exonuclease/phosphatase family metal-dependent hydrolase
MPLPRGADHWQRHAMWRGCIAILLLLSLAAATIRPRAPRTTLSIATWNMEWLASPATAHAARLACRGGRRATLPCDVARDHSRDSADLSRIAWYAHKLDADVVAFQEVENSAIAARIFADHRICIAAGRGLQHVGFAIRAGIAHRCGPQLDAISLGGAQRAGMRLVLFPETPQAVELLAVHLKSGCADDPLDSGSAACVLLAAQARQLSAWIAAHARSRFILLGDFNRGDARVATDGFWRTLAAGEPSRAPFLFASAGVPFRNCHVGAGFTRAIDHILVSRALLPDVVPASFRKSGYSESDAIRYRLPDHCPVSFFLNPGQSSASFQ